MIYNIVYRRCRMPRKQEKELAEFEKFATTELDRDTAIKLREDYLFNGLTLADLATKYNIQYKYIQQLYITEEWKKLRKEVEENTAIMTSREEEELYLMKVKIMRNIKEKIDFGLQMTQEAFESESSERLKDCKIYMEIIRMAREEYVKALNIKDDVMMPEDNKIIVSMGDVDFEV
jgi:hypothetical protein